MYHRYNDLSNTSALNYLHVNSGTFEHSPMWIRLTSKFPFQLSKPLTCLATAICSKPKIRFSFKNCQDNCHVSPLQYASCNTTFKSFVICIAAVKSHVLRYISRVQDSTKRHCVMVDGPKRSIRATSLAQSWLSGCACHCLHIPWLRMDEEEEEEVVAVLWLARWLEKQVTCEIDMQQNVVVWRALVVLCANA